MFIPRLFKHSKIAAVCFVSFIALFLYINYKWGVVASPIYQLGMFSGVAHIADTQTVYSIFSDNKPVVLNKQPFVYNDMVLVSLSRYESHEQHNRNVMEVFNKFTSRLLNQPLAAEVFTNNLNDQDVHLWFKQIMQGYGMPNNKISVYSHRYIWKNKVLMPVNQIEIKKVFVTDL